MANSNPSPKTRFKPGQSGNPSGRSSAELVAMNESARIAAELTHKALSSLQEKLGEADINLDQALAMLVSKDVRGLMKEAQDRAHGTPTQHVESKHDVADSLTELLGQVASTGKRIGS